MLGDVDQLDYDLDKDEEEALLADDTYDQEHETEEHETTEDTEDVLDIDASDVLDDNDENFSGKLICCPIHNIW